jgi:hypothetical protein
LPSKIVGIGALTGRDAAWLIDKEHEVVAVQPVIAVDGSRARGKIAKWEGSTGIDFGGPTTTESQPMERIINDPNGALCRQVNAN